MKWIPNVLSVIRILLSVSLLTLMPATVLFWCIYGLGGLSDMADGYLARKMNAASKTGAALDSGGFGICCCYGVSCVSACEDSLMGTCLDRSDCRYKIADYFRGVYEVPCVYRFTYVWE